MSGEKVTFARDVVTSVFFELWGRFDPRLAWSIDPQAFVDRLCPVGGYRRGKARMKDLELLYIPRLCAEGDPGDLFGAMRPVNVTERLIAQFVNEGLLTKRAKVDGSVSAWGAEIKHALHVPSGVALDLFAATEVNWANRLVVTTGPVELNKRIAAAAREKGWEWEVSEAGFVPLGKTWATAERERRTMHTEAEVFAFVGMECPQPEDRK
jgi:DNA polymerase/3'-5' exonuclease PolX